MVKKSQGLEVIEEDFQNLIQNNSAKTSSNNMSDAKKL